MNKWKRFLAVWKAVEEGIYRRPAIDEFKVRAAFNRYLKVVGEEESF